MEALSLLRYWRTGDATRNDNETTPTATTAVTGVSNHTSETEDDENDDHGPFFDLEFSLPGDEIGDEELVKNCDENEEEDSDGSDESEEDESEMKLTSLFQPGSSGDSTADVTVTLSVSPSDDLFFNGGFVPVEQTEEISLNPPESRVSLMKSATKFRVMMLKLKKSKLKSNSESSVNEKTENEDSGKSTAEDGPVVSLFKRRNSSKQKKRQNENESVSASSDEKKFTKKAMQEYLRKVKPLYVRVSKRYGEKLKFTGQLSLPVPKIPNPAGTEEQKQKQSPVENENESILEASEPPLLQSTVLGLKQGNLPAGLRVVCKHLRKSRSAFTAVAAAPPAAISSNRRDDSLLQQQDGIQSAILHCKRSFKASRDSDCSSSSASEPASQDGKCENSWNSDTADGKEKPEINKKVDEKGGKSYDCD